MGARIRRAEGTRREREPWIVAADSRQGPWIVAAAAADSRQDPWTGGLAVQTGRAEGAAIELGTEVYRPDPVLARKVVALAVGAVQASRAEAVQGPVVHAARLVWAAPAAAEAGGVGN